MAFPIPLNGIIQYVLLFTLCSVFNVYSGCSMDPFFLLDTSFYLLVSWWIFGLFPFSCYYEEGYYECSRPGSMWTCSLGHVPKSGTSGSYCNSFLIPSRTEVMFRTQIQELLPVFHHLSLRMKLLLSTRIVWYLCIVLTSWAQNSYSHLAVQLILWIAGKQTQALCFCIAKTSSTLPCIQQELLLCAFEWVESVNFTCWNLQNLSNTK